MTEIEIDVKAKIFDDPEYCSVGGEIKNADDYCHYGFMSLCKCFVDENFSPTAREYDADYRAFKKLPECKEEWEKVKAMKNIENLKENQQDLEPEFSKTVDDNFWELT